MCDDTTSDSNAEGSLRKQRARVQKEACSDAASKLTATSVVPCVAAMRKKGADLSTSCSELKAGQLMLPFLFGFNILPKPRSDLFCLSCRRGVQSRFRVAWSLGAAADWLLSLSWASHLLTNG